MAKLLESIIATRISEAVEVHQLLPGTYLGGRKGISIDHIIQLIINRVRRAWGRGRQASMVLLDVAGAYDNVSHQQILSNIYRLGLGFFVPWAEAFLTNQCTRIKLPGFLSEPFPTPTGIP
ncbi:hypothetical protein N7481_010152 [Penicillium waksmanii]|uniref:uncharacterized protein n=1 Tax=Penicillium waksmanii TaxID=69791 RepID=UPI002546F215|nr:uncharacterized protein N7481_010152 [Penicillium waksmanii]KAJ5976445.1 hypothetical protein N7481_010152 [Penicillium waksmanii]